MALKIWVLAGISAGLATAVLVGSLAGSTDRSQIRRGAAVYAEACASCHGDRLEGQSDWRNPKADGTLLAPPHNNDGHTWHHSDRLLLRYIKLGGQQALGNPKGFKSAMPGFAETLTDQQIWDVLAFIKSHWPARARAYQAAATENDK